MPFVPSISEEEVRAVQRAWARAIKTISKTYLSGGAGSGSFNRSMDTISDVLLRSTMTIVENIRESCREHGRGAFKTRAQSLWNS